MEYRGKALPKDLPKVALSQNQDKVIKDKYLKDAPSTEAWLWNISYNLALADILYMKEADEREVFRGVTYSFEEHESANGKKAKLLLMHSHFHNYHEWDTNFKKFIANLEELSSKNQIIKEQVSKRAASFYKLMAKMEFLPNSPTLMNAGRDLQQLSACYVLPVGDSIEEIYDCVKSMAMVHKSGGGTGFSFSRLRPKNAPVKTTKGVSSGPVSFMSLFDKSTDVVKQGGTRRGANMGILRYDHPDIREFIHCKDGNNAFENFNISVTIDKRFMEAIMQNKDIGLFNPKDGQQVESINAKALFDEMVESAWKSGDPGIIIIDRINETESNPTPHVGMIESTNPCVVGETRVFTNNGLIQIKDLIETQNEISVVTDNRTTMNGGLILEQGGVSLSKASQVVLTGKKETFKLKTESGFEVAATADHKIMTKRGWVELKRLSIADEVLISSDEGRFGRNNELPVKSKYAVAWSKELGQVLGWLVGGGWLTIGKYPRVGFTFGQGDKAILEYLKPAINILYGRDINEIKRFNNVYHLSYHSKEFVSLFTSLGIRPVKAACKEVPSSIFSAPKYAAEGFLQGLFSSGGRICAKGKNNTSYIRLTSKSRDLLAQTQLLLLNFGIKSRIIDRHRNKRITFEYKNILGELKLYESDGLLYELQISKDMIPLFLQKVGFLCNRHHEKVSRLDKAKFYKTSFTDRVISIEPKGIENVYDLTEPRTHSFIANGIVVHNCGEQPLLPHEPCNLGSINLYKFADESRKDFDWPRLKASVSLATQMLDNVIDVNNYPIPKIEYMAKLGRRIGLGVMGWAESLVALEIPYNSEAAYKKAEEVMKFINDEARRTSEELAKARGLFPSWKGSIYDQKSKYFKGRSSLARNSAITTIAPTGTIGIAAGLQGAGIEPFFAIAYVRYNAGGIDSLKKGLVPAENQTFFEVNPLFKKIAQEHGFFGCSEQELYKKIEENHKSLKGVRDIPESIQNLFLTSHDITPLEHVRIQAAFQKYTDNAVSKTVNLKNDATVEDVREVYLLAYELGCKGVTIYRDGCKQFQILNINSTAAASKMEEPAAVQVERMPTSSSYHLVQTGQGPLHIHINSDQYGPLQVFANISPTGTEISGMTTALGIIISKYLEEGGNPNRLIKHLNSVKGDKPFGFGPKRIDSIPHGLSKALKDHLTSMGRFEGLSGSLMSGQTMLPGSRPLQPVHGPAFTDEKKQSLFCQKCYSTNVEMVSGCSEPTCFDCGYSKCS